MKPNLRVIALMGAVVLSFLVGPALAQDAKVAQGMKVFETQKCVLCHSLEGKGNAKGPLDGVGSRLTAGEIRTWLVDPKTMIEKTKAERKPPMRAFANLPAEDLDALVAYVLSLKKK